MEIGGYLGLDDFPNHEYYPNLVALNTGRNALVYLIRVKKIEKLYIPRYLCDSVYRVCEREGCEYEFYDIREDFQPIFDKRLEEREYLYIVNYYGQVTNETELKNRYERIILDNVQAFFQKPAEGIDTIYSCRKFFGVPDGAYLSTDQLIPELPVDVSKDRMTHILGRYEGSANEYYQDFVNNDESFYDLELMKMSKLTHNILGSIDYNGIKKKREDNFNRLHDELKAVNRLTIEPPEGPYMYPLYIKDGIRIKTKLAEKKIYIPTLWPNAISMGGLSKDYGENLVPLPCDQRYGIEEMKYIVWEVFR